MTNPGETEKRDRYHHGDLRAQLVEATRELVELKGPDHFSLSEASRAAGVSTAAPYKHFKDKDELLSEVARQGMLRQRAQMLEELAKYPEGSLARITALGRVYVRFAVSEPGVFRLMFALSGGHADQAELVGEGRSTFSLVEQEVAAVLGRSEVGPDEIRRAFMLWSFVHGLSFLQIDGKLAKLEMEIDIESLLAEIATRVMT